MNVGNIYIKQKLSEARSLIYTNTIQPKLWWSRGRSDVSDIVDSASGRSLDLVTQTQSYELYLCHERILFNFFKSAATSFLISIMEWCLA